MTDFLENYPPMYVSSDVKGHDGDLGRGSGVIWKQSVSPWEQSQLAGGVSVLGKVDIEE